MRNPGFPWLVLRLMKEFDIEIPPARPFVCSFPFSPLLGSRIRPILWKCRAQSRVFAIKMLNASRRVPQNVGFNGLETRSTTEIRPENFISLPASTYSELYFESFTRQFSGLPFRKVEFIGIDLLHRLQGSRNLVFFRVIIFFLE